LNIRLWITGNQITGPPIRSLRCTSGLSQILRIPRLRINRRRPRVVRSVAVVPYWPWTTISAPQKVYSQQIPQVYRRYHRVFLWICLTILFNYGPINAVDMDHRIVAQVECMGWISGSLYRGRCTGDPLQIECAWTCKYKILAIETCPVLYLRIDRAVFSCGLILQHFYNYSSSQIPRIAQMNLELHNALPLLASALPAPYNLAFTFFSKEMSWSLTANSFVTSAVSAISTPFEIPFLIKSLLLPSLAAATLTK